MVAENDASGNSQKGTSNTQLEEPNYTQVPNLLFEHMAEMTEAELRCMLAIVRKIIGYHKDGPEALSYSQLEKLTGMSRQGVIQGIEKAITRGWLKVAGQGKRGMEYVVYIPKGVEVTVNLADAKGNLTAEWLDPVSGTRTSHGQADAGGKRTFASPKPGDAVLWLQPSRGKD